MNLTVDSMTVHYGGDGNAVTVTAVDDVSLDVQSGDVVALVGPSGSGKSTLLRAVAGLEPMSSGRVSVDGNDLADIPAHARGIGMMFQDNALFAHRSVGANVGYGLEIAGWDPPDQRRRVAELLDLVGMAGYESRSVEQLSGGESQRVALARSLAPRPSVLLLDEPLGSLDRLLRDQLVDDLGRLLREVGQTAVYVTHDQGEAFALADRIAVLSSGRLRQVGRPDDLWKNPGSGFVARFLGHRNVWTLAQMGSHGLTTDLKSRCGDSPLVLVPLSAVSLSTAVPSTGRVLSAAVLSCRFNQGVYDVVVESETAGFERIAVRTGEAVEPGATVSISVNVEAAVPLGDDDSLDELLT